MIDPTIYVITYHQFNHENPQQWPLDPRFLHSDKNYKYYLIDDEIPPPLRGKKVVLEKELDPLLHLAGKRHLAEWSFLLAEEKHSFCTYPLFMISSRFYQKNARLKTDLNQEWERLFSLFHEYAWGFLPSNNFDLTWYDLSWEKSVFTAYKKFFFFPFREKTYELTRTLYGISIPQDYRYTIDMFSNYLGFRSRRDLLAYVHFYKPIISTIFDEHFALKVDLSEYAVDTGRFRNERPFTFILELFSHLFFFKNSEKFFALHYDGYHEIDEKHTHSHPLLQHP